MTGRRRRPSEADRWDKGARSLVGRRFSGALTVTTPANIQFGAGWAAWAAGNATYPISGSSSMTVGSLTIYEAAWLRMGPIVFVYFYAAMTPSGGGSTIYVTLPTTMPASVGIPLAGWLNGGTGNFYANLTGSAGSMAVVAISYTSGANFAANTAITAIFSGYYRCA